MAAYAFFISETYLKNNSPLSGNIDIAELYPFAKTAEDIYIQQGIGTCLYDRLITSLTNSPPDTTTDETTLLKKIRKALVWYTAFDALPFIAIKVRNIGVVKQTGENLESSTREDVSYLRKLLKDKADEYMRLLQMYLCENSDLFTEYCCPNWTCDKLMPNTNTGSSSDIAFDRNLTKPGEIDINFVRKWIN